MSSKIQILRRDTRQRGATIVEFSLVFLLFVVILVALMEFGRAMWTYAMIAHATRQAGLRQRPAARLLYGPRD